jgi:DNA-binding XRE family transcriptional regulator
MTTGVASKVGRREKESKARSGTKDSNDGGNGGRGQKNFSRVRGLRAQWGYTQCDMAKFIEVSVATYCRKERGVQEFTHREIGVILQVFDKKYEEIFA